MAAACRSLGLYGNTREDYRRRVLKEEAAVESLTRLEGQGAFEKVMTRLWSDAENYEQALVFGEGSVRRKEYIARAMAREILSREGKETSDAAANGYICGVLKQAGYRAPQDASGAQVFDNLTDFEQRRVIYMLSKHVSRLRKREKEETAKEAADEPRQN